MHHDRRKTVTVQYFQAAWGWEYVRFEEVEDMGDRRVWRVIVR
jgi:hypothetical protein